MNIFPRLSLLLGCLLLLGCDTFTSKNQSSITSDTINNTKEDLVLLDNQYVINGHSFSDALTTVYLHKFENRIPVIIDSVTVVDKKFQFKGDIDTPDYYSLSSNLSNKRFRLLIDASKINVFLNETIENSSSYSSTPIQKDYAAYSKKMYSFRNKGVDLYYNLKGDFSNKSISKLRKDRSALFKQTGEYTRQFIQDNPNSYFTTLVIKENIDAYGHQKLREFYNSLSPEIKSMASVKAIDSLIIEKENYVAKPIPIKAETVAKTYEEYRPKAYSLSGKNQYGETMSLNSIPRGKVVLLDFWASWCGPCRASNPNLVALYNKYNADGFEIMSISEDKGQAEWISAIHVDNLNWDYHILDKNKSIAFRYGVESIPFKLLIDKKGRIASEKISGRKLEQRIIELLAE
ncbi:TlpA disulfide reductase family protein [Olleya sp. YS]|uniref:TlpA disulfide reductase family protein n=1 Tax=Olleya sp. YS TaxID=3028318 RepID=UPI002434176B|nr:TlpA disulfide reductase family protein [Olleya sp. YS]WGD34558.1 TlpA disulfide reductase family protein [Olleya sp. YS]